MNKNVVSAIFRWKEFANTLAEKRTEARGCFGSNKVSKTVLFLS